MESSDPTAINCSHCNTLLPAAAKFCSKCGKGMVAKKEYTFDRDLKSFFLITTLIIGYILALYILKVGGNTISNLIVDIFFLALVLAILWFNWKSVKSAFSLEKFQASKLLKYVLLQLGLTSLVIGFSCILTSFLGEDKTSLLDSYGDSFSPLLFAALSIAVFPAITEEIAFRAILFNSVSKLTTPVSTIFVTGIIFGFVHFSFLSILWLIPAGLFFGWVRHKEGIIWYGVACHFLHNFTMVMIDYFTVHAS